MRSAGQKYNIHLRAYFQPIPYARRQILFRRTLPTPKSFVFETELDAVAYPQGRDEGLMEHLFTEFVSFLISKFFFIYENKNFFTFQIAIPVCMTNIIKNPVQFYQYSLFYTYIENALQSR